MCGLAGYFGNRASNDLPGSVLLQSMAKAIAHRGPDGHGETSPDDLASQAIGLSHVRLAITGIEGGQQPMSFNDGRFTIVFNGQIFNHMELRTELEAKGHQFQTQCDTEVLLQLYARMGADCLSRLNGDFALAIWDAEKQRLMLARDRMGVRPLFYTKIKETLYFASEIKALLQVPDINTSLNKQALDQIFTLWSPVAPETAFTNIFELEPAHMMLCTKQGSVLTSNIYRYWAMDYPDQNDISPSACEDKAADHLLELLTDATRLRLQAEVPVGSYLSGGLDSSLITALASQLCDQQLQSFSLSFGHAEYDESGFQREVAELLRTRHHQANCDDGDIAKIFPAVIRATECPLVRTAPAPLYMLAGLVHDRGMKAVLTGEGADEIFAGYDIFREARIRRFCARQPQSQIRPHLFGKLYPYLPGLKAQTAEYLSAYFGATGSSTEDPLYSHRPRFKSTGAAKLFFSPELKQELADYDATETLLDKLPSRFSHWHPLHQAQYLECRFLLPGYILSSQGDRVAMANGVEGRFPFLDHRLVEFATTLPPEMKLKGLTEKYLLRKVSKNLIPESILQRKKQPYRAPDSQSFTGKGELAYVEELFSEQKIAETGLFNPQSVARLYKKNKTQPLTGFRDNTAYVGILSTQLWLESFTIKQQ